MRFISLIRKREKVDIDITGPNHNCMAANYGQYSCKQLIPLLDSFNRIKIRGRIYNLPKLEYIKKLYDESWNVPMRNDKGRNNFKKSK